MPAVLKSLFGFMIRPRACAAALALVGACTDTVLAPIRARDASAGADAAACSDPDDAACSPQLRCVEGVYDGLFMGSLRASAVGVPGVVTLLSDDDHKVALNFGLHLHGGEGSLRGVSACIHLRDIGLDGVVLEENSRAEFTGEADCATGLLQGEARGFYTSPSLTALGDVQTFFYKGSATATFDPETQSFVDGTLELNEPPVLVGEQPGGKGTWRARLLANEELPPEEDCLGIEFPESMFL